MIAIYFDPKNLKPEYVSFWENYEIHAQKATDKVLADWEQWLQRKEKEPDLEEFSYNFNQDIWKSLKAWPELRAPRIRKKGSVSLLKSRMRLYWIILVTFG